MKPSGADVVGGEQTGGAVSHVVVRHPGRGRREDRQAGGRAVQGLDLRLLVNRQVQGVLRGVHVQADKTTAGILDRARTATAASAPRFSAHPMLLAALQFPVGQAVVVRMTFTP